MDRLAQRGTHLLVRRYRSSVVACPYWKEVDSSEATVRFWQEIYDSDGKLAEMHEKYPMDKGHQKL